MPDPPLAGAASLSFQYGEFVNKADKKKAQKAQYQLKIDGSLANREVNTFTFNLQKTIPTPALTTGVAYLKRQL